MTFRLPSSPFAWSLLLTMPLTDNDSSVGNGLFLAITDLTWMFKYHQKHYDISKYFNATLVQSVKSRAATSEQRMKKQLPLSASVWMGSSKWAKSPRTKVCAQGQSQAGCIPTPLLLSKILDPFKKVHKTKNSTTRQLCLFTALGFLYFFCSKMRYSVSQRMRQTLCENIPSHFPHIPSPFYSPHAWAKPVHQHFILLTKEAFSVLPLIFSSLRVLV